jgi:hypothetical protein
MNAPVSVPPIMLRLVRQTAMHADCAVATLASLCGLTYDEALVVCARVAPTVLDEGMSWRELRAAAKAIGVPTRLLRRGQYDEDEATGILCVQTGEPTDHFVLLWQGRVIDGNATLYLSVDDYCKTHKYTPGTLLVRTDCDPTT